MRLFMGSVRDRESIVGVRSALDIFWKMDCGDADVKVVPTLERGLIGCSVLSKSMEGCSLTLSAMSFAPSDAHHQCNRNSVLLMSVGGR
jgi:hypothetical protein